LRGWLRIWAPLVPIALLSLMALMACSSSSSGDGSSPAASDGGVSEASDAGDPGDAGDAGADPSYNPNPTRLDPTNGDPSLDIAGSSIYFDNNQPWVRAQFNGAWPPPATLYFWSCSVFLSNVNAPIVTYTVQNLSGTQTDSADGLDKAKITFATEPNGFRVLFADSTIDFDHYALECSVKKTNAGTLAQVSSGPFEVPLTNRQARTFGP
jgi:hypothetical protein